MNQPGNIIPHSRACCSLEHLGVGSAWQIFCSSPVEEASALNQPGSITPHTKIKPTDLNTLARSKRTERDMELSKQSNSQMRNGEKRSERVQKYAPIGLVLSSSEQGTDPINIILGMGPDFSSDPAGDGPVYNSNTRRRGEERCERAQEFTPLRSVPSSSEQRTDPTNIVLGMGPEFSSDPAGDGPVYSSDTESSD